MEFLTLIKSEYLSDATLETMHADSKIWLAEVEFWLDEIESGYKAVTSISTSTLEKLRSEICLHGYELAVLLKSRSLGDELCIRDTHRKLLEDILVTGNVIRDSK